MDSPTATNILTDAAKTAAQLSVDASVTAQEVIATIAEATMHAQERQANDQEHIKKVLVDALNQVFGEKEKSQQFINVSRVPMICAQIQEIHKNIGEMTGILLELQIVKKIVFAMCGAVGLGVVASILNIVIRK